MPRQATKRPRLDAGPGRHLRLLLLLLVASIATCLVALRPPGSGPSGAAAQTPEPEVWFGPYPAGYHPPGLLPDYGATDYMALFDDDAPWLGARERLDVFQFYFGWLLQAAAEDIDTAVDFLTGHGIAIAIEAPALTRQQDCGINGEGWVEDAVAGTVQVIDAVVAAGGTVTYITLQEPYTAASPYASAPPPLSCHWTADQTAQHVAAYIAAVKQTYPGVQFGDVESDHLTPAQLDEWIVEYIEHVGQPPAYLHWDVDWSFRSDWPERAAAVEALMAGRGIPFGMIYNGIESDASNSAWIEHAIEHAARYEGMAGGTPDHVMFQSWHRYPKQLLPETDPAAMTSLINRYFDLRTAASLALGPATATTRTATVAATSSGSPVAGAPVEVRYRVLDGPGVEGTYVIAGQVPAGAARATIGYRVNMECHCGFQESYFRFWEGQFRSASTQRAVGGSPNRILNASFTSGFAPWHWSPEAASTFVLASGTTPAHVAVDAPNSEARMLNSGWVDVTAGHYFEARFRATVDPRTIGSGYFTVVFVNAEWAEVGRMRLAIEPEIVVAAGVTDASGVANVDLPALPPARITAFARVAGEADRLPGYSPRATAGALEPLITGVTPVAAGAPAQVLTITGERFNWDSAITWDGAPRPTTFVSSTELRVAVTAEDLATAGAHTVSVATPPPGGGSHAFTAQVSPRTITISGAAEVDEGATYTLNLGALYPGDGTIERWTITWCEGSPAHQVNGNPSSVTHVFPDGPKDCTITATATDADGTWPATDPVSVTVRDVAPTILVSGPDTVAEGSQYTVAFSATDPGADTVQGWTIDWGDGSEAVLQASTTSASPFSTPRR